MHCPCCFSQTAHSLADVGQYRAWRCGDCGSDWIDRNALKMNPPPVYDSYDHNVNVFREFAEIKDQYLTSFTRRLRRSVPSGSSAKAFLDFGCAGGEYLCCARETGFQEAWGVEVDAEAKEHARQYGRVETDLSDFPSNYFDVVQAKNVLSNLDHLEETMLELKRVLKPGGTMWLDVLNQDSMNAFIRRLVPTVNKGHRFGYLRPPYVVTTFTEKGVRRLLKRHNLRVDRIRARHFGSVDVPRQLPPRKLWWGRFSSLVGKGSVWVCDAQDTA